MKLSMVALAALSGSAAAESASPYPFYQGALLGYVTSMGGLSESDCYSYSSYGTCTLTSYQQMQTPVTNPIAYGKNIIYTTSSGYYYSNKVVYTSLSDSLQNETYRSVDLNADCGMDVVSSSSSSVYGPQVNLAPRAEFRSINSTDGELIPKQRELNFQVVAFNRSSNYSRPNETYFRVHDVDLSRDGDCRVKDLSPSIEDQRKLKIGTGSLVCTVRNDVIDNNVTGVVRSTHYNLIQHDLYSGVCRATNYQNSCLRLVKFDTYSNGTKGSLTVQDISGFPSTVNFRTDQTPCFYEDGRRSIAVLGTSNSNAVIVRIDNLDYYYSSPTVTIVRTLEYPQVYPASSTLMNIDGNMGFVSGNSVLVYDLGGDLVTNKTLPVATQSSYSGALSFATYRANVNSTRPAKGEVEKPVAK